MGNLPRPSKGGEKDNNTSNIPFIYPALGTHIPKAGYFFRLQQCRTLHYQLNIKTIQYVNTNIYSPRIW
jgi:hypothetical protein